MEWRGGAHHGHLRRAGILTASTLGPKPLLTIPGALHVCTISILLVLTAKLTPGRPSHPHRPSGVGNDRGDFTRIRLTSGALSWQSHHQLPLQMAWPWFTKCTKRQTYVQLFSNFIIKKSERALGTETDICQRQETAAKHRGPNPNANPRPLCRQLHVCSQFFS